MYRHTGGYLANAGASQLLVIDIQERLAAAIPEADRRRCIANSSLLLKTAALLEIPISATEQYPKGLGPTDTGIQACFTKHTALLAKTTFSCCGAEDFNTTLNREQRPQVIIAGMEAHVCVQQTALELHEQGFQIFVVDDAIAARVPSDQHIAMERMRQAGIIITTTEAVLFEWLRDSKHEHFKAVSAMVRERTRPN